MLSSRHPTAGLSFKPVLASSPPRLVPNRVRCAVAPQGEHSAARRQVLQGLVGGLALLPAGAVQAVTPIGFLDDRGSKPALDRFQEAADFDEDIRVRRGEQQFRSSVEATKERMGESKTRLEGIYTDLAKNRWTAGRNELRLQTGYLRYDLGVLEQAAKNKKDAKLAGDALVASMERLDYAILKKDKPGALAAHSAMMESLSSAMRSVA